MTTAAVLLFGAAPASAQETEPPTVPTETTAPPSTTPPAETTPPSSETPTPTQPTQPVEPSTPTEPSQPSETPSTTPEKPAEKPAEQPKQDEPKQEEVEKPEAKGPQADLKVTTAFDKAEYESGVDLGITVTVANVGAVPAQDIRFATDTSSLWLRTGYEQLGSRPTLGPGEQKTIKLTAAPKYRGVSQADFTARAFLDGIADPTPGNNAMSATARIHLRQGNVSGVLYTDANGNGRYDTGEGVANTYVMGQGPSPQDSLFARTDENGRFSISQVFAGKYVLRLDNLKLTPKPGEIVVEEGKTTQVELAVTPTTMDTLKPAIELDNTLYGKDSPISIKVTLRNTGQAPLTGVVALCDTGGPEWYLKGDGPGWAPLSPDGPGVTLAAGETKVITVTDVVHEAAYLYGAVGVACNFGNNGRNPYGTIGASDFAVVEGAFGSLRGKVVNQETGAPVSGVKIVGLDPVTRRPVGGSGTTDGNGQWQMYGVRQGALVLQAVGPWKHADGSNGLPVTVLGGREVTADIAVVPGPEVPDPTIHKPDLQLTATFDKPSYDVYDQIQVKFKIANIGRGFQTWGGYLQTDYLENGLDFDEGQLAPLRNLRPGLWPGESREVTLVGTVRTYSPKDTVAFKARLTSTDPNDDPANNSVEIVAPVTYATGDATVTVYGDRNDNGQLDAGEELAGRKVSISGGRPYKSADGDTDGSGKVVFRSLSAGRYDVYPQSVQDDEWVPERSGFVTAFVDNGVETKVVLRMVRPLAHTVEASLQFAKSTYQPGEQVSLFVTVQNNGDKPVQVKAECRGDRPAYYLDNDNLRWGKWIVDGEGYEVEPHRTVNLYVEQPMPALSPDHGLVAVACSFGTDPMAWGNPRAEAKAKVPGATWTTSGRVLTSGAEEKGVGNTKVVLLDPDTNKPVARTTTDAQGAFTFPDLPVGHYTPVVVGPWKVVSHRQGPLFGVVRGSTYPVDVYVEPGPNVVDPDSGELLPPPHGGNPPLSQVKGGGLATTGVSVVGLTAFGLLLVMAGAALRGRRRPAIA